MSRPAFSSCDLSTPLALIQNRVSSLRAREVPVREAADLVEPHHVAQVALVEVLVHGERRGEEVELVHPLPCRADVGGDLVAVPELGLEIGDELVVDHELRLGERREALEDVGRVVGHPCRCRAPSS